jgi:Mor family transcriptional regulator
MPGRKSGYQSIALDIVDACPRTLGRDTAVKGVRNLCRRFGGGLYYIPFYKKDSRILTEMKSTLSAAVGERGAKIIIEKMTALIGGQQVYIPLERYAFEDVIAEEIYKRNTEENVRLCDMFLDYGICFPKVYKLWHKGRRIKLNREGKK